MSISRLMQMGASGNVPSDLIVDQTSTFTTPLQNATISETRSNGTNYPALANRSYDSSDFSWAQTNNPTNFSGFTAYIDWNVDQQNGDIVMVFATSGHGTGFNNRSFAAIGLVNNDSTKYFRFARSSYNSDYANYWVNSTTETSGELTVASETSIARSNWYMGFRYSMSTGQFKGYKSYDSGSTWALAVSGTHAAYADMTQVFIETNKRTGSGNKIALLDASLYKDDIVL
jgi:hypothetical protein